MEQPMIRGYSLKRTAAFIDHHFDPHTARRVKATVPEALAVATNAKPADWQPRVHSVEMFRAIASAKGEPKAAYADLVECGRYICSEATNTFFLIMMKIMTPSLFAKKLPSFWQRDQQGGYYEFDVSNADERRITLWLRDVADYDHIAPVGVGFVGFVLSTMGKRGVEIAESSWSLNEPAPKDIEFQVTWQ